MSLEWIFFWVLFGLLVLLGAIWNLVVIYSIIYMKIPVSDFLRKWSYVPWALSIFSCAIVLYFVLQMLVVSVTGHDIVLFLDRERAARQVARTLGYQVREERGNNDLRRRIKEMAGEND